MRSAARSGKSLVRRVALASALAAGLGGAAAAIAVGTTAGGLLRSHDEDVLRAAASHLAQEVEEEALDLVDDDADEARARGTRLYEEALADELPDLDLPEARARIDGPDGHIAGDPRLPRAALGACATETFAGRPVHLCAVPIGDRWTLTLTTSASDARARLPLLGWSALVGILIGALIGGFASHRAAVWALGPLAALSERVRAVRPSDPRPEVLAPPLEHRELEALRGAIALLVEQLSAALASARGFAAEAAHELRTPLTTIAGELELLAERAPPEDAVAVEAARRRISDLVTLVQRLLILAQADPLDGGGDAVDLADVLDAARAALPEASRARLDVEAEDDVLVRGDASLLGALLTNAIDNALKFSAGAVEVRIAREGDEARITVRDGGPGIAAEDVERVFAPFYRTADARRSGALGHGVGLALIAHVAKVHGGGARIDSAPGRGTRLEVRLPRWMPRPR